MPRLVVVGAFVASGWLAQAATALGAQGPVSVFPSPGSRAALPAAQIVFRGLPPGSIGSIQVVGSRSGVHTGGLRGDSDNDGASFVPRTQFTPGETVTVTTGVDVLGGSGGGFSFAIVKPAGRLFSIPLPLVPAGSNSLQRFHTRRDLLPPAVAVKRRSSSVAPGDIFVANQFGPAQNGPIILDRDGNLVWFQPMPTNGMATDFRVQSYQGKPVLTWWQGYLNAGVGIGEGVISDTSYRRIATVKAADDLKADLHEFLLTPRDTAFIVAPSPVYADLSSVHGSKRAVVLDWAVQEIDVKTGLLLFEWHSLDHIDLRESYQPVPNGGHPFDPYHVNSVELDNDDNVIISARNTWAAYKVSYKTGGVIWRLGGKRSSFKLGRGVSFAWQHDIRIQGSGAVSLFDDGAAPAVHKQSRGITLALDTARMSAKVLREYVHAPGLLAGFEGGMQALSGGDFFVGWGQQPYFSEFDSQGRLLFDARFIAPTPTYRAYLFPWNATPSTPPSAAATSAGRGRSTVYASWNGATQVVSWRVLAGASRSTLQAINAAPRRGFETAIGIRSGGPYFAVQALGASGQVLASSNPVRVS